MKRLIIIIVILLIGLGGLAFYFTSTASSVQIKIDRPAKAKIVKRAQKNPDSLAAGAVVATFQSSYSGKLKNGSYAVIVDDPGYQIQAKDFTVNSKPVTLELTVKAAPAVLDQSLQAASQTIDTAFRSFLKSKGLSEDSYTLQSGQLYGSGEWYGALIVPKTGGDTLRIVLKKTGQSWSVATDPPNIIVSSVVFPDIPIEILRAVNSL